MHNAIFVQIKGAVSEQQLGENFLQTFRAYLFDVSKFITSDDPNDEQSLDLALNELQKFAPDAQSLNSKLTVASSLLNDVETKIESGKVSVHKSKVVALKASLEKLQNIFPTLQADCKKVMVCLDSSVSLSYSSIVPCNKEKDIFEGKTLSELASMLIENWKIWDNTTLRTIYLKLQIQCKDLVLELDNNKFNELCGCLECMSTHHDCAESTQKYANTLLYGINNWKLILKSQKEDSKTQLWDKSYNFSVKGVKTTEPLCPAHPHQSKNKQEIAQSSLSFQDISNTFEDCLDWIWSLIENKPCLCKKPMKTVLENLKGLATSGAETIEVLRLFNRGLKSFFAHPIKYLVDTEEENLIALEEILRLLKSLFPILSTDCDGVITWIDSLIQVLSSPGSETLSEQGASGTDWQSVTVDSTIANVTSELLISSSQELRAVVGRSISMLLAAEKISPTNLSVLLNNLLGRVDDLIRFIEPEQLSLMVTALNCICENTCFSQEISNTANELSRCIASSHTLKYYCQKTGVGVYSLFQGCINWIFALVEGESDTSSINIGTLFKQLRVLTNSRIDISHEAKQFCEVMKNILQNPEWYFSTVPEERILSLLNCLQQVEELFPTLPGCRNTMRYLVSRLRGVTYTLPEIPTRPCGEINGTSDFSTLVRVVRLVSTCWVDISEDRLTEVCRGLAIDVEVLARFLDKDLYRQLCLCLRSLVCRYPEEEKLNYFARIALNTLQVCRGTDPVTPLSSSEGIQKVEEADVMPTSRRNPSDGSQLSETISHTVIDWEMMAQRPELLEESTFEKICECIEQSSQHGSSSIVSTERRQHALSRASTTSKGTADLSDEELDAMELAERVHYLVDNWPSMRNVSLMKIYRHVILEGVTLPVTLGQDLLIRFMNSLQSMCDCYVPNTSEFISAKSMSALLTNNFKSTLSVALTSTPSHTHSVRTSEQETASQSDVSKKARVQHVCTNAISVLSDIKSVPSIEIVNVLQKLGAVLRSKYVHYIGQETRGRILTCLDSMWNSSSVPFGNRLLAVRIRSLLVLAQSRVKSSQPSGKSDIPSLKAHSLFIIELFLSQIWSVVDNENIPKNYLVGLLKEVKMLINSKADFSDGLQMLKRTVSWMLEDFNTSFGSLSQTQSQQVLMAFQRLGHILSKLDVYQSIRSLLSELMNKLQSRAIAVKPKSEPRHSASITIIPTAPSRTSSIQGEGGSTNEVLSTLSSGSSVIVMDCLAEVAKILVKNSVQLTREDYENTPIVNLVSGDDKKTLESYSYCQQSVKNLLKLCAEDENRGSVSTSEQGRLCRDVEAMLEQCTFVPDMDVVAGLFEKLLLFVEEDRADITYIFGKLAQRMLKAQGCSPESSILVTESILKLMGIITAEISFRNNYCCISGLLSGEENIPVEQTIAYSLLRSCKDFCENSKRTGTIMAQMKELLSVLVENSGNVFSSGLSMYASEAMVNQCNETITQLSRTMRQS